MMKYKIKKTCDVSADAIINFFVIELLRFCGKLLIPVLKVR
jgi:hypothetical protein